VYPAAHRAACGKAAVVKTAADTPQKQNRARILPAFSARKSRSENGTPQDQTTLPDDIFRQGTRNLKEMMQQKPRFRTLQAAHIHILLIKRRIAFLVADRIFSAAPLCIAPGFTRSFGAWGG